MNTHCFAQHLPPNHKRLQQFKAFTTHCSIHFGHEQGICTVNIHKLTVTNMPNIIIKFINCKPGVSKPQSLKPFGAACKGFLIRCSIILNYYYSASKLSQPVLCEKFLKLQQNVLKNTSPAMPNLQIVVI